MPCPEFPRITEAESRALTAQLIEMESLEEKPRQETIDRLLRKIIGSALD